MNKILEIIGFVLVGGTIYSYVGMYNNELRWPVFVGCAAGALVIIMYKKKLSKK